MFLISQRRNKFSWERDRCATHFKPLTSIHPLVIVSVLAPLPALVHSSNKACGWELFVYCLSPWTGHELREGRGFVFFISEFPKPDQKMLVEFSYNTSPSDYTVSQMRAWARLFDDLGIQNKGNLVYLSSQTASSNTAVTGILRHWEEERGWAAWGRWATAWGKACNRGCSCSSQRTLSGPGFVFENTVSHVRKVGWGQCRKGQVKMFEV